MGNGQQEGQQEAEQQDSQQVSPDELNASVERNRTQLMSTFAAAMGTYNQGVLNNFNAALENFETTVRSASSQEARADILGIMAKTALEEGFKELSKQVLGKAAPVAGAVLAFAKNIKQEIDRAAAAAVSHNVGDWIKDLRTSANDAFTRSGSSQALLNAVNSAYTDMGSEEDRQAFIDDLTFASASVQEGTWAVADTSVYERSLYEGWITGHFSMIGRVDDDISGFVDVRFEDGDMPTSTAAVAPMGDKIGDALNRVASISGVSTMMDLAVHKRVCKRADNAVGGSGWSCGWFDDRNQLINEPNSDAVTNFLKSPDWMRNVTLFR